MLLERSWGPELTLPRSVCLLQCVYVSTLHVQDVVFTLKFESLCNLSHLVRCVSMFSFLLGMKGPGAQHKHNACMQTNIFAVPMCKGLPSQVPVDRTDFVIAPVPGYAYSRSTSTLWHLPIAAVLS